MHRLNAVRAQLGGFEGKRVQRPAEVACQRQRLERELLTRLHQREDGHHATPSSRITFTTAGAASGPWPRISACLPCPGGTTRRCFWSLASGRPAVICSTGFER